MMMIIIMSDLKRRTGYWNLNEEALDRTLCRTRIARCYGPVVRQTTELMENVSVRFLNNMEFDIKNIIPLRLEAVLL